MFCHSVFQLKVTVFLVSNSCPKNKKLLSERCFLTSFKVTVSTVVCHSWLSICVGVCATGLINLNIK